MIDAPPPHEQQGHATTSDRFFNRMRRLGVARRPGWVGGVCAGLADRWGFNPLIVRGVVVVLAVVGAPVLLLYAACWMLLPDGAGRVHAQSMLHGRFTPPVIASLVLAIVALAPLLRGPWWPDWWLNGPLTALPSFGGLIWALLLVGLGAVLALTLTRRR